MKNKKILLVGGSGFIGHNLSIYLKNKGHEPYIVDSLSVNNILWVSGRCCPSLSPILLLHETFFDVERISAKRVEPQKGGLRINRYLFFFRANRKFFNEFFFEIAKKYSFLFLESSLFT